MRTLANIGKEGSEIIPTWIDLDTASAPIAKIFMAWVAAARAHLNPNIVERVSFYVTSVTVVVVASISYTPTGFGGVSMRTGDRVELPTITLAQPKWDAVGVFTNRSERDQSPKTLTCDINLFGHRAAPTGSGSSGEVGAFNTGFAAHSNRGSP